MFSKQNWLAIFTPPPLRSPQFFNAVKAALLVGFYLALSPALLTPGYAATLALGVVACALADHDELYLSRVTSLIQLMCCFGLASLSVTLLYPWPILFTLGLLSSTFLFVMAAAFGPKYGAMTMSSLIVAVYTMLGYDQFNDPWDQPMLLMVGAASYFVISALLQLLRPEQNLEHQNDELYALLASYQQSKARYFYTDTDFTQLRQSLAKKSAAIGQALAEMRTQLITRQQQNAQATEDSGFLDQFFKAQLLLERLSSSHIDYQKINIELATTPIPSQIRIVMTELAQRIESQPLYRKSRKYPEKDSLTQTFEQLKLQIEQEMQRGKHSAILLNQLSYLATNLSRVEEMTRTHTQFPTVGFQFKPLEGMNLKDKFRQFISPSTPLFRHALRQSLCMTFGYLLLQLGGGDSQSYWLLLTTLLITKPNYSATKARLLQRINGTVLGIILAGLLLLFKWPFWFMALMASVSALLFFWYFRKSYGIAVVMITVFVALTLSMQGSDATHALTTRITATLLGAAMVYLALRYIWPDWQRHYTQPILKRLVTHFSQYQQAIFSQYQNDNYDEDESYRLSRFHAYLSESELVTHWQALNAEPEAQRARIATLYQLTGCFHSYLSHLSALAAHRSTHQSATATTLIADIGERLSEALRLVADTLDGQSPQEETRSAHQQAREIGLVVKRLIPNLVGKDLLIAFQLQQLSENIEEIQRSIIDRGRIAPPLATE
jgi:uncharacterized membrane protein (TIGR01666 family)